MNRFHDQCKYCRKLVDDEETDGGEVYDWCYVEEDIDSYDICQKFDDRRVAELTQNQADFQQQTGEQHE